MRVGKNLGRFYIRVFESGRRIYHPKPGQCYLVYPLSIVSPSEQNQGGLLVGGLGWSYDQQGGPDGGWATAPYAADQLGAPFGFSFTTDAFGFDLTRPIVLQPGQ